MIRFKDKVVRHGTHVWTLSGTITHQRVELSLNNFYGDVTVGNELHEALRKMIAASPRYSRVFEGGAA